MYNKYTVYFIIFIVYLYYLYLLTNITQEFVEKMPESYIYTTKCKIDS